VLAANRSPIAEKRAADAVFRLADLDQVLPQCDTIVIACALAPETQGLINAHHLALVKPGALLINIARGPIVDEDALYAALKDHRLGGAAIDAWWQYSTLAEPGRRPSRHPFHELSNVLMTPHCSAFTDGTVERRWNSVSGNLERFTRGEPLDNVIVRT
jgi:phosphoglycerate dehydrogenase-like enzyme